MTSFGMFTLEGDLAVKRVLDKSFEKQLTWDLVLDELRKLSEKPKYEEALDTDVTDAATEYYLKKNSTNFDPFILLSLNMNNPDIKEMFKNNKRLNSTLKKYVEFGIVKKPRWL